MSKRILLVFAALLTTGCVGRADDPYVAGSYSTGQAQEIIMDVRDRRIEVLPSEDDQIHLDYFQNETERYAIELADGILTVNYAAVQNDVVLYPDLIKVQLSMKDGSVIGVEAGNYLMNHTQRTLELPAISEEDAVARIGTQLTPLAARLCVIPVDAGEALCYEIRATDGTDTFLVYIDAMTGTERELMQVVNDENGALVM